MSCWVKELPPIGEMFPSFDIGDAGGDVDENENFQQVMAAIAPQGEG